MFTWFRKNKTSQPQPTRAAMERETVRMFAGNTEIDSFHWTDVVSIRAWKQDCYVTDCIWLAFDIHGRDEAVCVHEEMEGYKPLIDELQRRCPGYLHNWWTAVAFPAFAESHTFIWHRGSPAPAQSQDPPS